MIQTMAQKLFGSAKKSLKLLLNLEATTKQNLLSYLAECREIVGAAEIQEKKNQQVIKIVRLLLSDPESLKRALEERSRHRDR